VVLAAMLVLVLVPSVRLKESALLTSERQ
jgi:hypothetical protein